MGRKATGLSSFTITRIGQQGCRANTAPPWDRISHGLVPDGGIVMIYCFIAKCKIALSHIPSRTLITSIVALLTCLFFSSTSHSAAITLVWDPNIEPDLAGYKLYYGNASGNYINTVDVGNRVKANS